MCLQCDRAEHSRSGTAVCPRSAGGATVCSGVSIHHLWDIHSTADYIHPQGNVIETRVHLHSSAYYIHPPNNARVLTLHSIANYIIMHPKGHEQ